MSKIDELIANLKDTWYSAKEVNELLEQLRPYLMSESDKRKIRFAEIQSRIGEFSRKTFPKSNPASKFNHLCNEMLELRECLETNKSSDEISGEIADCMILLFDIADYLEFDALNAVTEKHKINLQRNWGEPNEFGVVQHI